MLWLLALGFLGLASAMKCKTAFYNNNPCNHRQLLYDKECGNSCTASVCCADVYYTQGGFVVYNDDNLRWTKFLLVKEGCAAVHAASIPYDRVDKNIRVRGQYSPPAKQISWVYGPDFPIIDKAHSGQTSQVIRYNSQMFGSTAHNTWKWRLGVNDYELCVPCGTSSKRGFMLQMYDTTVSNTNGDEFCTANGYEGSTCEFTSGETHTTTCKAPPTPCTQNANNEDCVNGYAIGIIEEGTCACECNEGWQGVACEDDGCDENFKVVAGNCTACEAGKYRVAGDLAHEDTECITSTVGKNCTFDNDCVSLEICAENLCACPPGMTNAQGDDASQGDTECDVLYCQKDERVENNLCVPCPPGTIRPAGDDARGDDTSCTQAICSANHRVLNNECVPCEAGLIRLAGDRADRADTECFDASTCGGVTCDAIGTEACVNHKCVCKNLFGGQDCSKDRSPSARRNKVKEARKKALPTRQNMKDRQKMVKDLAREILQEELNKGVSTKQAIKNARVEIESQDLQQEVQIVVSKIAKSPVMAVAPENKDETDNCDQGPACASLDIAEEGNEITFLDTAEEAGSWSVLSNSQDIVTKQVKVSDGVYDMYCWNNTWGTKTTVDVTSGGKLYECNGHIILVGSQAAICTPTTCQNGGTCSVDGLSFMCTCPDGFSGDFCESSLDTGHCHQIDCSDFGGHKAGECTDCNVANCCQYPTRALFDAHCDGLTATQDYVEAKCCHRTYCL